VDFWDQLENVAFLIRVSININVLNKSFVYKKAHFTVYKS
jgi:hypothetical protein